MAVRTEVLIPGVVPFKVLFMLRLV